MINNSDCTVALSARDEYWKNRILTMESRHLDRIKNLKDIRQREVHRIMAEALLAAATKLDNYSDVFDIYSAIDFLYDEVEELKRHDGD